MTVETQPQYQVKAPLNFKSPDPGGTYKPASELNNTILLVRPIERILGIQEPQESIKPQVTTIVFNDRSKQHLELVDARKKEFDAVLKHKSEAGQFSSHDPVFDWVNFELAETEEQQQAVKIDMEREISTTLRERYHSPLSIVTYILDDKGVAYSKDDPIEPVDVKFQRGATYRITHGSPEPEREQKTVDAGILAKRKLADPNTPLYSKAVVVSPPSKVQNSIYQDNFVDIYEADLDSATGRRIIKMYRFASSLKKGAFDVQCLEPVFIDAEQDKRVVAELFNQEFRLQKEVISEEDFQEILTESLSIRQNYIDVVCSKVFNPIEIAVAFNAVLNKADAIRRKIINKGKGILRSFRNLGERVINTFKNAKEEADHLGRQAVEKMMGGCGISGGFSIGSLISSIGESVSSAISGIFGGFSKDKDYCIRCGACGKEIKCVVKKGGHCPRCNAVRRC